MLVDNVALLFGATARSQAYLQAMAKAGLMPECCILFASSKEDFYGQHGERDAYTDRSERLVDTLERCKIPFRILEERDINSEAAAEAISSLSQKYIVYSGYGGVILKPHLFHLGKRYIHVHAGILPKYRGSTTAYYSMLQEGCIGATAIFLNEEIDQGDVLFRETYPVPEGETDFDYAYEPWVRGQVLVKTLEKYVKEGKFQAIPQGNSGAETYYIIHPVLKHLAMLKARKGAPEE